MLREYEVGDLKILVGSEELDTGDYELKELKISMIENNHTILTLALEIKKELDDVYNLNKFIKMEKGRGSGETNYNYQKIEIILGRTSYFTGYVTEISKNIENSGGILIMLKSTSKTIQLDRVKRYRAYQNANMTYNELINNVMKKYEHDINFLVNDKLKTAGSIEEIIIQYGETDWDFLKRVASKVGFGVYSAGYGEVILGHNKDDGRKRLCEEHFDEGSIVDAKGNTAIRLWTYGSYLAGDNLYIDGVDKGFVSQGEIDYVNGRFKGNYLLRRREYKYPYIGNTNIKGNSVECRVISVPKQGEKEIAIMTVDFTSGLSKIAAIRNREDNETESLEDYLGENKRYCNFPYVTPYSQTNTGFFCTPEVGDTVAIYFPIEEEKAGYIQGAVNNLGNGRFSNPEKRNYTVKTDGDSSGKETFNFTLDLDKHEMYAANSLEQTAEKKILLSSNDFAGINSVNELILYVHKSMKLSGEDHLSNFKKSHENVTEKKVEIMDILEGNYMSELKITTQNKKLKVSDSYLASIPKVSMKK